MDFAFDARTEELRANLLDFLTGSVEPAEAVFHQQLAAADDRWAWDAAPVLAQLRGQARRRGLWNLFLPGARGAGLTTLQYAPLAEITGRSLLLAPAALNCAAPDTGNMEVLDSFGTPEQQRDWLDPLLDGRIRSAFAMTEPEVASSDATNIATRIERDGDHYVINGHKWWITGAMNPNCRIFIVMGKTDPDAPRHRQQSMILVPRDTPGLQIRRGMEVFGYDDHEHGGHAELTLTDVRVPASNLIGAPGDGFAIAQARLGPGRIHHCMRAIGLAERAIERMCARADERVAFGRPLAQQGGDPGLDRSVAGTHRAAAAAGAQDGLADGHRRQQGRPHRDPGHQDRDTRDGAMDPGQGDPDPRCGRAVPGLLAGPCLRRDSHAAFRRRPGRGAPQCAGPGRAGPAGGDPQLIR